MKFLFQPPYKAFTGKKRLYRCNRSTREMTGRWANGLFPAEHRLEPSRRVGGSSSVPQTAHCPVWPLMTTGTSLWLATGDCRVTWTAEG